MVVSGPEYSRVPRATAGFCLQSGSPSPHIYTQNSRLRARLSLKSPGLDNLPTLSLWTFIKPNSFLKSAI